MLQLSEKPELDEDESENRRSSEARAQLDRAFSRLESAIDNLADSRANDNANAQNIPVSAEEYQALKAELKALTAENEKLMRLLQETEDNYSNLKRASKTVSGKLNGSISKLKQLLEE